MKQIRILLADDHGLMRLGLKTLMKVHSDLAVVGGAENGLEAVELARRVRPDVVVMDLVMPVMDGVEATRRIRSDLPDTKVLILTTFGTSVDIARAIDAGATGALMKDTPNDELIEVVRKVAAGRMVVSEEIQRTLWQDPPPPKLTSRQLEVLESIVRGFTNPDISKRLGISADAVKQHLNAVYSKLGAANRVEAVAIALRRHLLKI